MGQSSVVLMREGGEVTPKIQIKDQSKERSSFDRSVRDASSGLTDFPLPSEHRVSDVVETGYCDLHWDPQTGFWGYHTNERAWTDITETSDGNLSDSSVRLYTKFDSVYTAENHLDLFLKNHLFSVLNHR